MSGQVRGVDGEPVPGARIEVWQADEDGFYDVQYADLDEARGRGHLDADADADGRYWFSSVQPEAVVGVKSSLVTAFARHEGGTAPDGREMAGAWSGTEFDLVLARS